MRRWPGHLFRRLALCRERGWSPREYASDIDSSFGLTIGFEGRSFAGLFTLAEGAADVLGTHLALHELMLPDACTGGAQGSLSLRDPNGGWYRIAFENCTDCGPIAFEGTPIGEACVDFGPFLTRVGSWP